MRIRPVHQPDGREVLHAAEADAPQLVEEHRHQPERVGAADACEHRRLAHDREHLARHVDDDLVRVAERHQAGQRPAPAHAVAAAVVDDDQVGAACLGELGRQARAGAGADDRHAGGDLRAQTRECLVAGHDAPRISSCSRSAIAIANAGSLMFSGRSCSSTRSSSVSFRPGDERRVRVRIVERLAADVDHRDAAERDEDRGRPVSPPRACARSSGRAQPDSAGVVRISVTVGLCT